MTVQEFASQTGARFLSQPQQDRSILCGYTCDLLSHVMGNGVADMAWVTVQTHMNVIAVGTLLDLACIIIPESLAVETAIIEKAQQEEIALLSTSMTAYEVIAYLSQNGIPAAKKS